MHEHDGPDDGPRISHSLTVATTRHDTTREEVTATYRGAWRGQPAEVTMIARRYTTADEAFTPWSIYPGAARAAAHPDGIPGRALTDTARARLGDQYRAELAAWLVGPDYGPSRARALYFDLRDTAGRLSRHPGPRALRWALDAHGAELEPAHRAHLERVVDAYDAYEAAYDAGPETP